MKDTEKLLSVLFLQTTAENKVVPQGSVLVLAASRAAVLVPVAVSRGVGDRAAANPVVGAVAEADPAAVAVEAAVEAVAVAAAVEAAAEAAAAAVAVEAAAAAAAVEAAAAAAEAVIRALAVKATALATSLLPAEATGEATILVPKVQEIVEESVSSLSG